MNNSWMLKRGDWIGTMFRAVVLSIVLFATLGLCFAVQMGLGLDVSTNSLLIAFVVFWIAMLASLIAAEYPQGDDHAMSRIGSATFCRTGLPLLVVVLIVRYSDASFAEETLGFMAAFYGVGLITSIGLSSKRFSTSTQEHREVDSAAD